jgi:hypothetical protein
MRKARILKNELNIWQIAWRQIETFLQRIHSVTEQDQPYRRVCEGLLRAARAIEHQRRLFKGEERPLSDPVVDELPTSYLDADGVFHQILDPSDDESGPWSLPFRQFRIPASDELELAVGNLLPKDDGVEEKVILKADQDLEFDFRYKENDPLQSVILPAYPGASEGHSIVPKNAEVDIEATSPDTASLFPMVNRKAATLNETETNWPVETGNEEPVAAWSLLCENRRTLRNGTDGESATYTGPAEGSLWRQELVTKAKNVVSQVKNNIPDLPGEKTAAEWLEEIKAAADGAAAWVEQDETDLLDAEDALQKEGSKLADLPGMLKTAAVSLGDQRAGFEAVADASQALLLTLGTSGSGGISSGTQRQNQLDLADDLDNAIDNLANFESNHDLFSEPAEKGYLAADLDAAFSARLSYPDGTLRMVRTMEFMLLATWPARKRWFRLRFANVLDPLFRGFRKPFITGIQALVNGGDTGLPCVGLSLSEDSPAAVGAETLTTGQPASMIDTLDDIETGHIGYLGGDRPAAAVILGMDAREGKLTLNCSPLRVSVDTGEPGTAGLVAGGEAIDCQAPGFNTVEMKRGEADAGPAADGPVHETVALWSRLALVFGWKTIERELKDDSTLTDSAFASLLVPEPSTEPLHDLRLYGRIPPDTLSLAISNVPDSYWETVDGEREPRIARPGEMLLLRGYAEPEEEGDPKPLAQAVVEIDAVYRITGDMLARMDDSSLALLSATDGEETGDDDCKLICGPKEEAIMVVIRRTWLRNDTLVDDIRLSRVFEGFDLPSLATETLLPEGFVTNVVGADTIDDGGMDRGAEFSAAREILAGWTRYAQTND